VASTTTRLERGLLAVAGGLAAGFFVAAIFTSSPWSDLFIGMATSFVFFVVFDLVLAIRRVLRHRQRRAFFGSESFDGEIWLVLADFELRDDVKGVLTAEQRRSPYQRPRIPGVPDHPHPITQTAMMCLMDFRAVMGLAEELAPWASARPHVKVDSDALKDRARSLVAAGLTDNHCTAMYLEVDPQPLFSISSVGMDTFVTLIDGLELRNTPAKEFGIIVRFTPDRQSHPGRRWFIVAGLDEAGTAAAGQYLAREWRTLHGLVAPASDFVAVISLPRLAWWEPTLEHVVSRDAAGATATKTVDA